MERITSSRAYRITYIGVPLIVAGLVVQERDRGFRHLRNDYVPSFRLHYDDYLQYAPAALMLGLKIVLVISGLMILQRLLEEFGILKILSAMLSPLMRLFGLNPDVAFLWLVGNLSLIHI